MSQESAFKLLYSEVFKSGGDVNKVMKNMHNQIKCYVKESFPYFLVADNYFYIPCYFTKKAVEQFKSKTPNVNITDLKREVIIIQDWSLELAQVNSANVFTSYAGVELKLIVKSFKVQPGGQSNKLSIIRYPVNIYRDSEIKNLVSSFVGAAQTSAISSGVKGESLPDISKMQAKASVTQGVVKFASGDTFTAYGFKSANTQTMDMNSIYKSEKGSLPSKKGDKQVKPKIQGGSKKIKKSPKKAGGIAGKLAKFTPGGKKSMPKKSVGRVGSATMASPGEGKSAAATA
jgi:hypothetical protein